MASQFDELLNDPAFALGISLLGGSREQNPILASMAAFQGWQGAQARQQELKTQAAMQAQRAKQLELETQRQQRESEWVANIPEDGTDYDKYIVDGIRRNVIDPTKGFTFLQSKADAKELKNLTIADLQQRQRELLAQKERDSLRDNAIKEQRLEQERILKTFDQQLRAGFLGVAQASAQTGRMVAENRILSKAEADEAKKQVAEAKNQAAQDKLSAKTREAMLKDQARLDFNDSSLNRLAETANELLQHKGLSGIVGTRGAFPNLPGSAAADAEALLNSLKAKVGFGALQTMRDNSKTGGALGQVSDKEHVLLQAQLEALEKAQSLGQMRKSLQGIVDFVTESKQRARSTFDKLYGGAVEAAPASGEWKIEKVQ